VLLADDVSMDFIVTWISNELEYLIYCLSKLKYKISDGMKDQSKSKSDRTKL
jgi:hypothetical protein